MRILCVSKWAECPRCRRLYLTWLGACPTCQGDERGAP
jgi:hypothetical protein